MAMKKPNLSKGAKIIIGVVLGLLIVGGGGGYGGYTYIKSSAENDTRAMIDKELAKVANQVEVTYKTVSVDIFEETATVHRIMARDKILGGPPITISKARISGVRQGKTGIEAMTLKLRGIKIPIMDAIKMALAEDASVGAIGADDQTEAAAFIGMGYQDLVGDADFKVNYEPKKETSAVSMKINFKGLGGWGMNLKVGGVTPELAALILEFNDRMSKLENPEAEQGILMMEMAGRVMPLVRGLTLHKVGLSLRDSGLGDRLIRAGLEAQYEVVDPKFARVEAAKKFKEEAIQAVKDQGLPEDIITRFIDPLTDMVEKGGKIGVQTSMAEPLKLFADEPGPFGIMPNKALNDPDAVMEILNFQVSR